ncbi:MAG: hypothetical protein ABJA94_11555, partial [Rhodoglobus sp.]
PPVPPAAEAPTHGTPYVPHTQQFSPMRMLTPQRVQGSPNTPGIWALALLPLAINVAVVGLYFTGILILPSRPTIQTLQSQPTQQMQALYSLGLVAAEFLIMILLVAADRSALKSRNIRPASGWWLLLLAPLVYFIARRMVLKRQGIVSNAPGNVYVLGLVLPYAAIFFTAFLATLN